LNDPAGRPQVTGLRRNILTEDLLPATQVVDRPMRKHPNDVTVDKVAAIESPSRTTSVDLESLVINRSRR